MSHLKGEENPQPDLGVITLVKLLCPHGAVGGLRGEKCLFGGFQAYRRGLERIFFLSGRQSVVLLYGRSSITLCRGSRVNAQNLLS